MLTYDQSPTTTFGSSLPSSKSSAALPSPRRKTSSLAPHHQHIFIVTGPAGCGKSTVAKYLADTFNLPYIEGDEYHTKEAVQKMADNVPLTDADRWSWLILLRNVASEKLHDGADGADGVVVTCSALRQRYRDVIRTAGYYDHNVLVHFIYLQASPELLLARVKARQNHYMKDSMVKSQLDCLEPPDEQEFDALTVDVSGSIHDVQNLAYQAVYRVLVNDSTDSNGA